jgi:hypothetical protein
MHPETSIASIAPIAAPRALLARNTLGALSAAFVAAGFVSFGGVGGALLAGTTFVAAVASRGGPLVGQLAARSYFLLVAAITAPAAVVVHGTALPLVAASAVVALLAPDPAPLRAAADRWGFSPLASRDGFLLSSTVAISAAAVLTLSGSLALQDNGASVLGWSSVGLALLAAMGVVAMLRMRALGFVALATAGATSSLLAVALLDGWVRRRLGVAHDPFAFTSFAMGGAAFSTIWVPLLVARRRALARLRVASTDVGRLRVAETSAWSEELHEDAHEPRGGERLRA